MSKTSEMPLASCDTAAATCTAACGAPCARRLRAASSAARSPWCARHGRRLPTRRRLAAPVLHHALDSSCDPLHVDESLVVTPRCTESAQCSRSDSQLVAGQMLHQCHCRGRVAGEDADFNRSAHPQRLHKDLLKLLLRVTSPQVLMRRLVRRQQSRHKA